MIKSRKKSISILITIVFVMTMLLPVGGAFAADMYYVPNPQTVADDTTGQTLGSIFVEVPGGILNAGDQIDIDLPSDFDIVDAGVAGFADDIAVAAGNTPAKSIAVGVPANARGETNEAAVTDVLAVINDSNSISITLDSSYPGADDGESTFIRIYFNAVDIADGASGDITATITGFGGFVNGKVVLGTVTAGKATVSVKDTVNLAGDGSIENITILESSAGALDADAQSVKLILPRGMTWDLTGAGVTVSGGGALVLGDPVADPAIPALSGEGTDTLSLYVKTKSTGTKAKIDLTGLAISIDESKAKYGDIEVRVRGKSDVEPSSIIIGSYNELGESVSTDADLETVIAGKYNQEINSIFVNENAAGSLVLNRTITFKLPAGAIWTSVGNNYSDSGATLTFAGFVGNDYRTIKYTVTATSTDAAEIELDDLEIALAPDFEGNVKVEVGGTQGIRDTLTVAEAVPNVTATVDEKAEVKIGMKNQVVADIVIKEGDAEAIEGDLDLIVTLPTGVEFSSVPSVEVTEGDLDIDENDVKRANGNRELIIPIDNSSNDASTIVISDVKLTVDRTVAEGDIIAEISGPAVAQVNDIDAINTDFTDADLDTKNVFEIDVDGTGVDFIELDARANLAEEGFFPNNEVAAEVAIAKVATPAPGDITASASFQISSTTYTLNGVEMTMDVAPYIKGDRTYLPIRYVAYALGLNDSNILWDGVAQKVTLIKGDKVVQLTIGSNILLVNGASITMDVAPEIVSDRTMLPIRHVAEVLGADVGWDPVTQTVTIN